MTIDSFLEHWQLIEHPFRGEEARQDPLLSRMVDASVRAAAENPMRPSRMPRHPDYDKIAGEFSRPSTSIVFGEKGSGKTAIRLQMSTSAAAYNAANPSRRVLLISHDELAPVLQRLHDRVKTVKKGKESPVIDSLKQMRLADHVDAVMCQVVPRLVDSLLEQGGPGQGAGGERIDLGPEPRKGLKKLDKDLKRDILVMQATYDRPDSADQRTRELRRALGVRMPAIVMIEDVMAFAGWIVPLAVFLLSRGSKAPYNDPIWVTSFSAAMGLWAVALLARAATERFGVRARAHRLRRQIRVSPRTEGSYARSIRQVPPAWRPSHLLPSTGSDDVRLAMLSRLVRVIRAYGFEHAVVLVDRVDEPPLIQGDPERMRAVVWPLLSNRFLQQEGVAFKMLLPIELRHSLMRESAAFFQDARLDKQSTIEALSWSGVALYDLCNQRLNACRPPDASPITLQDLFAADVARDSLLDALEQVRQPRDAFKLVYQCIYDHCTHTAEDLSNPGAYLIPKHVLDTAKRAQVERLRQLAMGVRPA
ncbi:MAG: hypothetical protein QM783_15340 [Phycisphaerales bacterium]